MIWPWVKTCETARPDAPEWKGLRAVWRRTSKSNCIAVEIHTSVEPVILYGRPVTEYATVHADSTTSHSVLTVVQLADLAHILKTL